MSTQPFVEYKIVRGTDVDDLERGVTAMMQMGWVPLGGVVQFQQVWNERVGTTSVPRMNLLLLQSMALPADAA